MKTTEMVMIRECGVYSCTYNRNNACHARAITVGGPEPECDTYFNDTAKAGGRETGGVGACRVRSCRFNESLECVAEGGVSVSSHARHAYCVTFKAR